MLIAGPTASGKSALAMAMAARENGVVVNADSAQVYRNLRILSARPTSDDEAVVAHRLFGHIDGAMPYSAAAWAQDARDVIAQIHASGRLPILVGGTGLYLRTLVDGIAPVPAIDPAIRAAVRALPVADAHAALSFEDPAGAARLAPADTTRVARALEVVRASGRTLASWQSARSGGIGGSVALEVHVLLPDRDWLFERIDRRLESMFDNGAIGEVAQLIGRADVPAEAPVRRAIGVTPIAAMLAGEIDRETAIQSAKTASRQYAKRQYTWFRNQRFHQPSDIT